MFTLFEQVKNMIDQRKINTFFINTETKLRRIEWLKNNNFGSENNLEGSCYKFYYESTLNDHEKIFIRNKIINDWGFPRVEFKGIFLYNPKIPLSYVIFIYTKPDPDIQPE